MGSLLAKSGFRRKTRVFNVRLTPMLISFFNHQGNNFEERQNDVLKKTLTCFKVEEV